MKILLAFAFSFIFIRFLLVTSQKIEDAYCPVQEEEGFNIDNYIGGDAYFELRLRWGYSICNINDDPKCITPIPKAFTIGGFCQDSTFQGTAASNIDFNLSKFNDELWADMLKYWPNIHTNASDLNNSNFRGNEWREHGRGSGFSHNCYFIQAIHLFETQVITDHVLRNFPPGPQQIFSHMELQRSLTDANIKHVFVKCNTNKEDEQQLQEIGISYRYENSQWSVVANPKKSECDVNEPIFFRDYE
ncbi:hypothetical protein MKX03_009122 [Papaver bracteatum]|nr:hypothetical protein MKX03_009122 [Papaver bracteatum]